MDLYLSKLLQELDEQLKKNNVGSLNGPLYQDLCKHIAFACFECNLNREGVFYLSEAHAASLRLECLYHESFQSIGLDTEHVSFHSSLMEQKYEGLEFRLKEMPKEWTLVQITKEYNPYSRWTKRSPDGALNCGGIHIVNYSCGDSRVPCHIMLPKPETSVDGSNIVQEIYNISVKHWASVGTLSAAKIKQKRVENCAQLKSLVTQITQRWLKEWSCLLLGKFQDVQIENSLRNAIDEILNASAAEIGAHNKEILYRIAYGCAHLNEDEIQSAVSYVTEDASLQANLCKKINSINDKYRNLIKLKRHPVILILDEDLEGIPWEMTTVLRIHPVSRMPSIHFLHALYKKHEARIVEGNAIISDPDNAYYIINPEQNLNSTEKRVGNFIKSRFPKWQGLTGVKPEKDDFAHALTEYDLFLYCGHGNGSQYLTSSDLVTLKTRAIPFLLGCSSFRPKHIGGRVGSYCLCFKYIIAGSLCMLGALWPITSTDIDNITIALLNHWLPGNRMDLKTIEGFSEEISTPELSLHEPELLRILKTSRETSLLYYNEASLVVYGLPVKIKS